MKNTILIASLKSWNHKNFKKLKRFYPKSHFVLVQNESDLNESFLNSLKPRYVFFPHWSSKIPKEIYQKYECVIFHIGDLPFGRGGSPLQNLIIRGIKQTKISALRACDVLDGGDIYLKEPLNIATGSAEQIYKRASKIIFFTMIPYILKHRPKPTPQNGDVVVFKRRKEEQSNLESLENPSLEQIYDFIRMLDAPSYPKAFIEFNGIRIEFNKAKLKNHQIIGRFQLCKKS